MINEITIRNRASYNENGIILNNLKEVNFIYGTNGAGKTTISETLKELELANNSDIKYTQNKMPIIVYNKSFVEQNFHQNNKIKGIFTLGKESYDIQEEIRVRKEKIDKIEDDINSTTKTLNEKCEELEHKEKDYENKCWEFKIKYDKEFNAAFVGYRNSKEKFKQKCKEESKKERKIVDIEKIKKDSQNIFRENIFEIDNLKLINSSGIEKLLNDEIIVTKIIGRNDLDIAKLITKLNISDWVKQGQNRLVDTNGICPFCQQELQENLLEKLNQYFDNTYEENIEKLKFLKGEYNLETNQIINYIESIEKINNQYIDNELLKVEISLLISKNNINLSLLDKKIKEPSFLFEMEYINKVINSINHLLSLANEEISKNNNIFKNLKNEKRVLISEIWTYISEQNDSNQKIYDTECRNLQKAIESISNRIQRKIKDKDQIISEIESYEQKITSIHPTVEAMNKLLKSFGFTNFKFNISDNKDNYKIERNDGIDAHNTLSEGEKTFVTFLYFIHLVRGSNDKNLITRNKIIVIDDPISSLDSNILFVVSSLIRRIIDDIRNKEGNIKQIFILTHNIYFHKEVSFNKKSTVTKAIDETFWILKKNNNVSEIINYDSNPIKTSYELLWREIKEASERSTSTIQNLIRRIIENYFKIYGNYTDDDIINKFEDDEKILCKSLISWTHDGSHFLNDDLYIEHPEEVGEKYLHIFRKIFVLTNHEAHYKMMMGIEEE